MRPTTIAIALLVGALLCARAGTSSAARSQKPPRRPSASRSEVDWRRTRHPVLDRFALPETGYYAGHDGDATFVIFRAPADFLRRARAHGWPRDGWSYSALGGGFLRITGAAERRLAGMVGPSRRQRAQLLGSLEQAMRQTGSSARERYRVPHDVRGGIKSARQGLKIAGVGAAIVTAGVAIELAMFSLLSGAVGAIAPHMTSFTGAPYP
jgi:hypothetical protein